LGEGSQDQTLEKKKGGSQASGLKVPACTGRIVRGGRLPEGEKNCGGNFGDLEIGEGKCTSCRGLRGG